MLIEWHRMNKILVIEDNKEIRENTAEILELNGFHVLTAENGNVGFALAKNHAPDLILCDIMMPETDGRAFLKLAKGEFIVCDIPIVFFSAGSSPELQKELTDGKNKYLKKPFTAEELLIIIKDGLNKNGNHSNHNTAHFY